MNDAAVTGMIVVVALIISGMIISRLVSRAVYPLREELFVLAATLLREKGTQSRERALLNAYMDRAMSFSAGWMAVRAALAVLRQRIEEGHSRPAEPPRCVRTRRASRLFLLSVLVANPIAGAIFVVVLGVGIALHREAPRQAVYQAAAKMPALSGAAFAH